MVLQVTPGQGQLLLHDAASVLEDPTGRLTLDAVRGQRFAPPAGGLSSFGFTASSYWFRFTLDNPGTATLPRLLVLRTNWLDTVDLYVPGADGQVVHRRFGDTLPFQEREYATPQFLVDLPVPPGQQTYYLRITSTQAFMAPMELWEPQAFHDSDRLWSAYYGMFYGILAVMVLYNAFIWTSTRDRNYLAYCAYLLSFFLMNAAYNGFAYQYFWPQSPRWSNWAHTPFIFAFQVVALWFTMHFLESRTRTPRVHRLMQLYLGLTLAAWVAVTLAGDPVAYNAAPVYCIFLGTPLILAAGLRAWWRGYRAARFFVLATMASLTGAFVTALTVSGLLPYTFARFHAAEFGILVDVVLLSLALADRINLMHQERRAAQAQATRQRLQASFLLEKANIRLEHQVQERTAELARARDEAEQLARLDVLTGVANRRSFQEVAEREFLRARRYSHALAVLVFDIDLFKQVNDTHGHAAGDMVICAVAGIVRGAVREVDFVARIGGEEFAVLLPEVQLADAQRTAERLRELVADWRGAFDGRVLRCTASFGVSIVEQDDPGFDTVLQRADQAMYAAKQAGRDQVSVYGALS
ncbi:7TM diverse intracellular signaling domain-containing protein [Pseudorhodoferax sp. Leaf274]|uniref:sensor domain-containing diguanylate cyclase n=1 Tax=Pseudorhodoferax sp. Leaf274 TaxID=1736318 RepID=UPI0007027665|nr:7TM diverse intracellular signaling domain-containing protein [Pseudorhodoferax sp. Leaf274]KQP46149.1 diguanylate cyclase [Pseudorhodoferax sp. Leaf274]